MNTAINEGTEAPDDSTSGTLSDKHWIGGIVRPRGLRRRGKPVRIAAWITTYGAVRSAAVVEGDGPDVLRSLLTEALRDAPNDQRPGRLTVWPSSKGAVAGLEIPSVLVERDEFLTVVVEDQVSSGYFPGALPVRRGARS